MQQIKYLTGKKRKIYNIYIKLYVLIHFAVEAVSGKFPSRNFLRFLRRLLFFLSKMKDNKYVKSGKFTKINLYVPAFPSKAFFKSCRKVIITNREMPCISVLISVTSACRYDCEHCYQKLDHGKDTDINLLCNVIEKLDKMGVSFFNIEGGEPFLVFERLLKVCKSVGTGEIWINSTGDGMTPEKLELLKSVGVKGIMFSLHSSIPYKVNEFMKSEKAWDNFIDGVGMCRNAGLEIAANTCIPRDDYFNGNFHSIVELANDLGISIIQLIKPKPSGGWLNADLNQFSKQDLDDIEKMVLNYNNNAEYKDYPFIAAQIAEEKSDMFGCTAGGTDRFYINAKGDVQPCEFLNISYGNIKEEDFEIIFNRMRQDFVTAGDCWLCEHYSKNILEIVNEENIKSLPLSYEHSKKVINNWNRGDIPDFYDKVVKY